MNMYKRYTIYGTGKLFRVGFYSAELLKTLAPENSIHYCIFVDYTEAVAKATYRPLSISKLQPWCISTRTDVGNSTVLGIIMASRIKKYFQTQMLD